MPMRLTQRDNHPPQNLCYYALCECSKTLWSTIGQFKTSLFAQGGFYLPLCKAQLDLLGSSGFCFSQNISVDVCGDVHITVTKMLRHNFQVDTAVQVPLSIKT